MITRRRVTLRHKMLVFTIGIVAALVALSLLVVRKYVADQAYRQASEDLQSTRTVFEAILADRTRWLNAQCEVVAHDPRFVSTLDIPTANFNQQRTTVIREARRFQSIIGSEVFLATDRRGRVLGRLDVLTAPERDLSRAPTVAAALEGAPHSGQLVLEGRTYQAATVPVSDGDRVLGTLSLGFSESQDLQWLVELLEGASATSDIREPIASGDLTGISSLTRQILIDADCDLVSITDAAGWVLSAVIREATFGEDMSAEPQIRQALDGDGWSGLRVERGRILQMVTVPVWSSGEIVGVLGTGFAVDDQLARNLRAMTRGEITFAANGSLVASTWGAGPRAALADQLFQPTSLYAEQTGPFEVEVDGETYLSLIGRLAEVGSESEGFYLVQFSLDHELATLRIIERMLMTVGVVVLLIGALLSYVGVDRIARPISALVDGTRRIGSGDLDHRILVKTRDEVGELGAAFNTMAEALGRSREALEASERLYRELFNNAQDVVFTTDLDHRLTTVNKAATEFWEYPEDELIGRPLFGLLTPGDAEKLQETERSPGSAPPWPAVEVEAVKKGGSKAALELTSRWITDRGEPAGVHGIGRDITQRREKELAAVRFRDQLYQAEKLRALGELAAGVAHNFNNLLTGVMGYAELMKLQADIPDPVQAYAGKIVESARRCSAIVSRIQAFGKPIDPSQTERVDLNKVVMETVDITQVRWRAAAEREGKKVEVELDLGDIPPVKSTGAAWEEILTNLIFNAVDAMPRGGRICISTEPGSDGAVLKVSDTGTGMDEETRRRVFEPFFTTKESDRGTGLGLSTVWGLVQAQGGNVEIETAPGEGTTFLIRVPAAPLNEQNDGADRAEEPPKSMSILLIDDEPSVLDFLPSLLVGHRVDTADNGMAGLRQFEQKRHDLVITDWVMEGMSGLTVADRVKRLSPRTAVVLMTGWEIEGTPASESPSVDLIFSKPFDAPKLDAALRQVSALHRGTRPESGSG